MYQLKGMLLSMLTAAICVSAYQTARSLPSALQIDVTADLPILTEQLSSEQQYAYCPPGVGCDPGGTR